LKKYRKNLKIPENLIKIKKSGKKNEKFWKRLIYIEIF